MNDLIKVKPNISLPYKCLFCDSDKVQVREVLFQGTHILADCSCKKCGGEFYHTLPVGHAQLFPVSFAKNGSYCKFDADTAKWLAEPLINSLFKNQKVDAVIDKKEFLKKESAIILNCLDSCFGHVLPRLWNAKFLVDRYPDVGVVVLLPKRMEWLVPEGVAEIWTVDAPLKTLQRWVSNLDSFVKNELLRFSRVFISPAHIHLDTGGITLPAYTKIKEFDLSAFGKKTPQVSFILRNDRFWHGNQWEFFFYQLCVKFKLLPFFRRIFIWKQNHLVNKVAKKIQRELKEVKFFAVGIDKAGGLSSLIEDLRNEVVPDFIEKEWCSVYANSHIVIGTHGSNMLIPTSLAAGFIELLPRYKIPHITEDLALHQKAEYSLFLGRHLDHFASTKLISLHAVSMIKDFPFKYENTEQNHKAYKK